MKYKLIVLLILLINSLFHCQEISKIEFSHSNAIILFSSIDIIFEPIKNNKRGTVKLTVKKGRDKEYNVRISKRKFGKIYHATQKIEYDTVAIKNNLIDGTFTSIDLYKDKEITKKYLASGINEKSKNDKFQKDFWYATKLIIEAARLSLRDLIGYEYKSR